MSEWTKNEHMMGTTIMAVEYDGGVVMGADSRTSTGSYVANRVSDKITALVDGENPNIWICRSGSAADTQAISDYVKKFLAMHSVELDEDPQVRTAARLTQQIIYNNKDGLLAGVIIAGWDSKGKGQVYQVPLGGTFVKQPYAIGGSGSTYIIGYCDAHYQPNMTKDEAIKFVHNSIALAISRDGSSGGVIRTVVISADGVEKAMLPGDQLPQFYQGP